MARRSERVLARKSELVTKELFMAVKLSDVNGVKRALARDGANPDANVFTGHSSLHWASDRGYTTIVDVLLENGADVNIKDIKGRTPLHWASDRGYTTIVDVLLENGADVNIKDTIKGRTPLHWAAVRDFPSIVKLLLEKGADTMLVDDAGRTSLRYAFHYGHKECVALIATDFISALKKAVSEMR